jgi:hypothetical protein
MLASLTVVTQLDTPALAACSPNAYEYCTGQCDATYYTCTVNNGSSVPCQESFKKCNCDCVKMCWPEQMCIEE